MVKNLPAMRENRVRSLGWEDPLEKEMPTHSSILVWRIPGTEELDELQSMGSQRVRHDWATNSFSFIIAKQPWSLSNVFFFFPSSLQVCFVLHFINEMYMLSYPCILGINPTLSWCVILLVCYWILFPNICWNFLSHSVLIWLWQQSEYWPHRLNFKVFCLLKFFWRIGIL